MDKKVKVFYDTEFFEDGPDKPILPISLGAVDEDGREFYVEFPFDWDACGNQWLHDNVRPHLLFPERPRANRDEFRRCFKISILDFLGGNVPELWAYYADYDHVVLYQLFGSMIDRPKGWPMYTRDIKQYADALGNPQLPKQGSTEHHALDDARWNKEAWEFLVGYEEKRKARAALIHSGEWAEGEE